MNTEREQIIRNVNDAFNSNDTSLFLSFCTDDVTWNMVGNSKTKGKESIMKMMEKMPDFSPNIIIEEMITEGDKSACTGSFTMPNEKGEITDYRFCDVYCFSGDKISKMDSYVVPVK